MLYSASQFVTVASTPSLARHGSPLSQASFAADIDMEHLNLDVRQPTLGDQALGSPAISAPTPRLSRQIVAFVAIGVIGYLIDATITWACARYLGLPPVLARPPGFILATVANFLLNRTFTFKGSRAPVVHAFVRYSAVASTGLAINYAVYALFVFFSLRIGVPVTPAILPMFIAAGSLSAMVVTFLGFKLFAFR